MSVSERILDHAKEISDLLRTRYGASGTSMGNLTRSVEAKLPIGTTLMLRRWTTIRNKVIKGRERFPIKVYYDEVGEDHYIKLTNEIIASLLGHNTRSHHQGPSELTQLQSPIYVEPDASNARIAKRVPERKSLPPVDASEEVLVVVTGSRNIIRIVEGDYRSKMEYEFSGTRVCSYVYVKPQSRLRLVAHGESNELLIEKAVYDRSRRMIGGRDNSIEVI